MNHKEWIILLFVVTEDDCLYKHSAHHTFDCDRAKGLWGEDDKKNKKIKR